MSSSPFPSFSEFVGSVYPPKSPCLKRERSDDDAPECPRSTKFPLIVRFEFDTPAARPSPSPAPPAPSPAPPAPSPAPPAPCSLMMDAIVHQVVHSDGYDSFGDSDMEESESDEEADTAAAASLLVDRPSVVELAVSNEYAMYRYCQDIADEQPENLCCAIEAWQYTRFTRKTWQSLCACDAKAQRDCTCHEKFPYCRFCDEQ